MSQRTAGRPTLRVARLIVLALLGAVAALVLGAGTASAAAPLESARTLVMADSGGASLCATPTSATCDAYPDGGYLPVLRWTGSATSLHYKTEGGITHIVSDMALWLQRDGAWPQWMTVGNTAWKVAASVLSFGVRAQPLQAAGYEVDRAVGQLGSALTDSGIVALFVGAALVSIAWRSWRQRRVPWAQAGRIVIVVGLMAAMTFGAQQSRMDVNGNYVAGVMSPGWFVDLGNKTIETIASAPAAALENLPSSDGSTGLPGNPAAVSDDANSCSQYEDALYQRYTSGAQGDGVLMSAVNVDLSKMWEQTGLEVWRTAQFGAKNPYGDYVYCHLLDSRAGIPASAQIALTTGGGAKYPAANPNSGAWATGDDNESLDRSMVAWAACRPSDGGWTVAGDFAFVDRSRGPIKPDTCQHWWTDNFFAGVNYRTQAQQYLAANPDGFHVAGSICAPGVTNTLDCWTTKDLKWSADTTAEALAWGGPCEYSQNRSDGGAADCHYVADDGSISQPSKPICTASQAAGSCVDQAAGTVGGILADDGSPLYWGGSSTNAINETANAPLTRNFMLALHGESNIGGTLATTIVYAIASIIVSVSFSLLGFGIFIAKLWPLVISVLLFFTFLRDVIFLDETSASLRLLKQDLGVTFFAFGVRLVLSLVMLLNAVLVAMGSKWFSPGDTESMVWLGMSPAISVLALHYVFTRVLKLPSPFSVKGVKTWGAAAAGGAVGGAVGSGLARVATSRLGRAGHAMSRNLSGAAMYRLGFAAPGGPRTRRPGSFTAGSAAAAAPGPITGSRTSERPGRRGAAMPTAMAGHDVPDAPTTGVAPPLTHGERVRHQAQERQAALLDGADISDSAVDRQCLAAARDARRAQAVDRRGYAGGFAGDVREAASARTAERLEEVRQRFAAKPVRATLGLAAKTAAAGFTVVGTAGLALPAMAAVSLYRNAPVAVEARRRAVSNFEYRQQVAAAARARQEARERADASPRHLQVQTVTAPPRRIR